MDMECPTPEQIIKARKKAGLSCEAAAKLIYKSGTTWQGWERGEQKMDPAYWELWQINAKVRGST